MTMRRLCQHIAALVCACAGLSAQTALASAPKSAFSPQYGMHADRETASSTAPFIERTAAMTVFSPDYRKALGWQMATARSSLASSVWTLQKIGTPQFAGYGAGTRFTFAPLMRGNDTRHLGVSFAHERHARRRRGGAPALKLRSRTGSHLFRAMRPVMAEFSDGRATDMDKWSLEYARTHGAWSWQGEFSGGQLDDGTEEAKLMAEYGALSWFVSGHTRRYDTVGGRFGRVQGISASHPGWELALRYEHIRGRQRGDNGLDTTDIETSAWTLASNWYLHPNLRLMLNLVATFDHDHNTHASSLTRELIARAQYDF